MHRFYVETNQIQGETVRITGPDVNHIRNVLRMKQGDELIICNGQGKDCYCIINKISEYEIIAEVKEYSDTGTELKAKITLFQGLPKKDKMELVIQKAVELGVYEIVPVMTKRVIVKLEDKKKEEKKLERWQTIAESAAKQSGRGIIPRIRPVISYMEAISEANKMDKGIIPYENAEGMHYTKEVLDQCSNCSTIGVFIGPEGGFEESEIILAKENGILPITLGRRILRTETAGLAILSMLVYLLED
ncbi:16S rRNA (uracil(1498)-N(3))-methyltransferase [Lachnospiraceae bacterium MD1]|jgi:16S rRNA (uracil1498-N3)-methyltransferase|uniref:Ribosomal RNA small subunit methyltransferase E n=1 Tax=Variimorphobacter saccharofermentans TaxID=2755051 RepID=A0A839K0Z3_9FIRM|nr:16S rRNA (uracil(1498)-N(3))-methyltransferase [Variimorphobacter saccharofermentans]MBB2183098.1 16S rRNA (uracil(1498)-N(3))-methyltransferase [Variimorphobacter saccharofermentans]